MSINRCDLCYEVVADTTCGSGTTTLLIELELNTFYWMWMEDVNGNVYQYGNNTDGSGAFTFDSQWFPEGMFNAYSGPYDVSFSTSQSTNTGEPFMVDGTEYNCLLLTYKNLIYVYD